MGRKRERTGWDQDELAAVLQVNFQILQNHSLHCELMQ